MKIDTTAPAEPSPARDSSALVSTVDDLAKLANYSFVNNLVSDPEADEQGHEHAPRQVFSGHYVPVVPTPLADPVYLAHSKDFFRELGFADSLAESEDFMRMFSGDLSHLPSPLRNVGWATGYALSIYGTEYYQQCPFQTGNGYGDGRAISVLEAVANGQRWEMQLKGGGRTPYCRGADGRAVLRSSVREFLAQEHMHSLNVPTSRSLTLYASLSEKVRRPWYSENSRSEDPDVLVDETVAISTRVAPSFLRVGQLELFGRRARKSEHATALEELEQIVLHLIDREYADVIDSRLSMSEKVVLLASEFRTRLASLVANWIRVGYCQGNFNSDNCAAGGFTLDYGPFGFCEVFDPYFQPWTGGGQHFAFLNQPAAAERNFTMLCKALLPLLEDDQQATRQMDEIQAGFMTVMQQEWEAMWSAKLGLGQFDAPLLQELVTLMTQTGVDYTIFFRELSSIPEDPVPLRKSFYQNPDDNTVASWSAWLTRWRSLVTESLASQSGQTIADISRQMKQVNPKYILREWQLAPAYQQASRGDYSLISELQQVMTRPYDEQSNAVEDKYYQLRPTAFHNMGGLSHMSCSS